MSGRFTCPCCGEKRSKPLPPEGLLDAPLTPAEYKILSKLIERKGRGIARDALTDHLYDEHPEGGPDHAYNTVCNHISRIRSKIQKFGWTIPMGRSDNWVYGKVKLEPLQ